MFGIELTRNICYSFSRYQIRKSWSTERKVESGMASKESYKRLEQNITDMIKEEQIKLGYRSETVRLYYPLGSLNHFLKADCTVEQMCQELSGFCEAVRGTLGKIEVTNRGERFCLAIPPKGTDYIHAHMGEREFLVDFIGAISRHGCTMDDIFRQFYRYSEHVHIEKTDGGEFDYMICFEDGVPDAFRYCIKQEGPHMIYHRFTAEDYADFQF